MQALPCTKPNGPWALTHASIGSQSWGRPTTSRRGRGRGRRPGPFWASHCGPEITGVDGAAFATGAIPMAARARPPAIIGPAAVAFRLSMKTPRQNIVVVLAPKGQAQVHLTDTVGAPRRPKRLISHVFRFRNHYSAGRTRVSTWRPRANGSSLCKLIYDADKLRLTWLDRRRNVKYVKKGGGA